MRKLSVLAVVLVLLAATAYELLVALKVFELGELPGEGPRGSELVGFVAAIGFLAALLLSAVLAVIDRAAPALAGLLAPAAAAFLVAYFYTFDPYYLPTRIRYSERDFVPPILVFTVAALCGGVGLLTLWKRRVGLALSVPLILACALTAFFAGVGH
jgi:hypothetical protein